MLRHSQFTGPQIHQRVRGSPTIDENSGCLSDVVMAESAVFQVPRPSTFCEIDSARAEISLASRLDLRGGRLASSPCVSDQRYVYVLLSTVHQNRYYTGLTANVQARLAAHNAGLSTHTASGRPWKLVTTIEFSDVDRAQIFEMYLKSGSGRAFARRYFR